MAARPVPAVLLAGLLALTVLAAQPAAAQTPQTCDPYQVNTNPPGILIDPDGCYREMVYETLEDPFYMTYLWDEVTDDVCLPTQPPYCPFDL